MQRQGRRALGTKKGKVHYVDDKRVRWDRYRKRYKGLFKKAWELSRMCGLSVHLSLFNEKGDLLEFSSEDVRSHFLRYKEHKEKGKCTVWFTDKSFQGNRMSTESEEEDGEEEEGAVSPSALYTNEGVDVPASCITNGHRQVEALSVSGGGGGNKLPTGFAEPVQALSSGGGFAPLLPSPFRSQASVPLVRPSVSPSYPLEEEEEFDSTTTSSYPSAECVEGVKCEEPEHNCTHIQQLQYPDLSAPQQQQEELGYSSGVGGVGNTDGPYLQYLSSSSSAPYSLNTFFM